MNSNQSSTEDIPPTKSSITVVSDDSETDSMASFGDAKPLKTVQFDEESPVRVKFQPGPNGETVAMTNSSGTQLIRLTKSITFDPYVAVKPIPNDQHSAYNPGWKANKSRLQHPTEAEDHVRETIRRIGGHLQDPITGDWVKVEADPNWQNHWSNSQASTKDLSNEHH